MNLFQWLTVPVLIAVALLDLAICIRNRRRLRLLRIAVCLVAAGLILYPETATSIARIVGIGRGTDLVVYAFMLVTSGVLLHFYGRQFTLRRDFVELARREALRTAEPGTGLSQFRIERLGRGNSFDEATSSSDSPGRSGDRHE